METTIIIVNIALGGLTIFVVSVSAKIIFGLILTPSIREFLLSRYRKFRAFIGFPSTVKLSVRATFNVVKENGKYYAYSPDCVPDDKGNIPYFLLGSREDLDKKNKSAIRT